MSLWQTHILASCNYYTKLEPSTIRFFSHTILRHPSLVVYPSHISLIPFIIFVGHYIIENDYHMVLLWRTTAYTIQTCKKHTKNRFWWCSHWWHIVWHVFFTYEHQCTCISSLPCLKTTHVHALCKCPTHVQIIYF
jgi:hypothetical protein